MAESIYTEELADQICNLVAQGMSMREVAEQIGITPQCVRKWLVEERGNLVAKYARAKEQAMDVMAEECLEISDDVKNDTHTTKYGDGTERESPNTEWISRSRLRVDTRKWLMSKLAPKKYADKIVQQHTGADGGPLTVSWKKAE